MGRDLRGAKLAGCKIVGIAHEECMNLALTPNSVRAVQANDAYGPVSEPQRRELQQVCQRPGISRGR
jgi:hypothetical protein